MKITIDTKEDSPDEIKRVVKMLEAWTEGHIAAPMNMFGDMGSGSGSIPGQGSGTDLFSLFDNKDSSSNGSSTIKTEEKEEDIPEIIPY